MKKIPKKIRWNNLGFPYRGNKGYIAEIISRFISKTIEKFDMNKSLYSPFFVSGAIELSCANLGIGVTGNDLSKKIAFLNLYKKYKRFQYEKMENPNCEDIEVEIKDFIKNFDNLLVEIFKENFIENTEIKKGPVERLNEELEKILDINIIKENKMSMSDDTSYFNLFERFLIERYNFFIKNEENDDLKKNVLEKIVIKILFTFLFSVYNSGVSTDHNKFSFLLSSDVSDEKLFFELEKKIYPYMFYEYPKNIKFFNCDYLKFLEIVDNQFMNEEKEKKGNIWFIDPPYCDKSKKNFSYFSNGSTIKIVDTLNSINQNLKKNKKDIFIITYNDLNLIAEELKKYNTINYYLLDLSKIINTKNGKQPKEYLFILHDNSNYPNDCVFDILKKELLEINEKKEIFDNKKYRLTYNCEIIEEKDELKIIEKYIFLIKKIIRFKFFHKTKFKYLVFEKIIKNCEKFKITISKYIINYYDNNKAEISWRDGQKKLIIIFEENCNQKFIKNFMSLPEKLLENNENQEEKEMEFV